MFGRWDGFDLEDDWLICPSGQRVRSNVVANLDYYSYLQRVRGFHSPWIPDVPGKFHDLILVDEMTRRAIEQTLEAARKLNYFPDAQSPNK